MKVTKEEFESFAALVSKDMKDCYMEVEGFDATFYCAYWHPSVKVLRDISDIAYVSIFPRLDRNIAVYITVCESAKEE